MLRHIVFFKARTPEDREAVFAGLRLLEDNPHALTVEVGRNLGLDDISPEVDFVVYAEFEGEADLRAFKDHPLYRQSIERVRPLRDLRIAGDFESPFAPDGGKDRAGGRRP